MDGKRENDYFAPLVVAPKYQGKYDEAEFNLATGQTNYNVKVNESDAFVNVARAHSVIIRTNYTITVRFNSTSYPAITIARSEGVLAIGREHGLEVTNIFISNASGSTAAIKIMLIE